MVSVTSLFLTGFTTILLGLGYYFIGQQEFQEYVLHRLGSQSEYHDKLEVSRKFKAYNPLGSELSRGIEGSLVEASPFDPQRKRFQRYIVPAPAHIPIVISPPKLVGIRLSEEGNTATFLISGGSLETLAIGQEIEFGTVTKISNTSVVFDAHDKVVELKLYD